MLPIQVFNYQSQFRVGLRHLCKCLMVKGSLQLLRRALLPIQVSYCQKQFTLGLRYYQRQFEVELCRLYPSILL